MMIIDSRWWARVTPIPAGAPHTVRSP